MSRENVGLRVFLGIAIGTSWAAIAQAQTVQPQADPEEVQNVESGDIVVTARRRDESLREVPLSISMLGGEAISEAKILNQAEMSFRVPNYQQSNGVNVAAFMRGVGSGSNPSFEQAVGTFVDGIYAGRGAQQTYPYFDLERIEVLRGPQVTLYGNSAIAGAVSVVTRKPGDELSADLKASYEFNHQQARLEGGVTLPVGDTFSVRVGGFYDKLDKGWLRTTRPTQFPGFVRQDPQWENWGGRISANYKIAPDIELDLKYEIWRIAQDGNTLQAVSNAGTPTVTEFEHNYDRAFGNAPPLPNNEFDAMRMKSQTLQGTISTETDFGTLSATSAYVWYDWLLNTEADQSPVPILNFLHTEDFNMFSQEIRLTSDGVGDFDYLAGVFFQREDLFLQGEFEGNFAAIGAPVPPFARNIQLDQKTQSFATFFDGNYKLTDRLTLNLGARYLYSEKTASQYSRAHDIVGNAPRPDLEVPLAALGGRSVFSLFFGQPHFFPRLKIAERHFMPLAGLKYEFVDDHMIFAKFVKGAKAGGFDWAVNHLRADEVDFKAEKATSYELGLKGLFRSAGLSYGLTAYRMEVDDLQVSAFDGNLGYIVGNAAEARSEGIEADFIWSMVEGLRLNGTLGYTDAKYISFQGAACFIELRLATPPGTVCRRDLSGGQLPFTAKWTWSLGAQYAFNFSNFEIETNVDYSHRGRTNIAHITDPGQFERAVGLLDARISLRPERGGWHLALIGKNLTDELYSTYGTEAPANPLVRLRDTQRPRQIALEVGWKY